MRKGERACNSSRYKKGLSISFERIDNNKGYSPTNCYFISKSKQNGNRRNSIMITIDNKTQCLAWWCKEFNLNRNKIKWVVESKKISYEQVIKQFIEIYKTTYHTETVIN